MSASVGPQIGIGGRSSPRSPVEERDQKEFEEKVSLAPKQEKTEEKPLSESFISSMIAGRTPPRLSLADVVPSLSSSPSSVFGPEIENLSMMSDSDIAADIAEVFLDNMEIVQSSGDPELAHAFQHLGELLANYEHLRLLRTGELG